VRWTRLVYEGDSITPYGEVTALEEKGGRTLVSMKVWSENQNGEQTAAGTATAFLQ
jgi:acyl dehydratase